MSARRVVRISSNRIEVANGDRVCCSGSALDVLCDECRAAAEAKSAPARMAAAHRVEHKADCVLRSASGGRYDVWKRGGDEVAPPPSLKDAIKRFRETGRVSIAERVAENAHVGEELTPLRPYATPSPTGLPRGEARRLPPNLRLDDALRGSAKGSGESYSEMMRRRYTEQVSAAAVKRAADAKRRRF